MTSREPLLDTWAEPTSSVLHRTVSWPQEFVSVGKEQFKLNLMLLHNHRRSCSETRGIKIDRPLRANSHSSCPSTMARERNVKHPCLHLRRRALQHSSARNCAVVTWHQTPSCFSCSALFKLFCISACYVTFCTSPTSDISWKHNCPTDSNTQYNIFNEHWLMRRGAAPTWNLQCYLTKFKGPPPPVL